MLQLSLDNLYRNNIISMFINNNLKKISFFKVDKEKISIEVTLINVRY